MQMATPKTAMALLEELRNASFATAQKELTVLRDFAASQVGIWIVKQVSVVIRSSSGNRQAATLG